MKTLRISLIISVLMLVPFFSVYGAIIRVPSDYPSINAALNAAFAGDTIIVAAGTYTDAGNGHDIIWPDTDNLTLQGAGPGLTIISSESLGRAIDIAFAITANISGITFTDGYSLYHSPGQDYGGSIRANDPGSTLILSNCHFLNNRSSTSGIAHESGGYGGAVYTAGAITTTNCTFEANQASESHTSSSGGWGGGVYVQGNCVMTNTNFIDNSSGDGGGSAGNGGGLAAPGVFSLEACSFVGNNTALGFYSAQGGGMWGGTGSISDCSFSGNLCGSQGATGSRGGAIYVSSAYIKNCSITNNNANLGTGGGIYAVGQLTLDHCSINNNSADIGGGFYAGGKAVVNASSMVSNSAQNGKGGGGSISDTGTVTNCVFAFNSQNSNSGGTNGGGLNVDGAATVYNCTFYSNAMATGGSNGTGGGIFIGGSDNRVVNSIFWANVSGYLPYTTQAFANEGEIRFCDVIGGAANVGPMTYGPGNISAEPQFVFTTAPGNLHIVYYSPCVDTGTSESAPMFDMDNYDRPSGKGYDIGAYEYQSPGPSIEAIYINNKRFASGDLTSGKADLKATLKSEFGVSSARLFIDNSTDPIVMIPTGGTTFEGDWICSFSLPTGYAGVTSHLLRFYLSDGVGNMRVKSYSAVVMAGQVQLVGQSLNYPNPFKPLSADPSSNTTNIQYTLSIDAPVTIVLYDITGHEVKRMTFNSGQNGGKAGVNAVSWNGRTLFGEVGGNGMYVYKIVSGNKVLGSSKIVILD